MRSLSHAVFLSPGRDGGPACPKMGYLAEVAESKGYFVEILDYTGVPDPEDRVQKLLKSRTAEFECLVLAGSSMGGYVSVVAAETLMVQGLFLVGPALYLQPYANQDPHPKARNITVVHGLQDAVVPPEHSRRFAEKFGAEIHLIEGGHSLHPQMPQVASLFGSFLDKIS